jgi:hypothetical protein
MSPEAQLRFNNLRASSAGAVFAEFLQAQLEDVKTQLVSAGIEHVQRLQGEAACLTKLITKLKRE